MYERSLATAFGSALSRRTAWHCRVRRGKRYGVVAGLVLALAFVSVCSAADDAFPGRNGRIVFTSVRANSGVELWSVKPDGSGLQRLTAHAAPINGTSPPAWAPDGRSIAFDAGVVLVVNVQTGRVRRLRKPILLLGGGLSWSPDGRRFVYRGRGGLWIARRDGSAQRQLTSESAGELPSWSPDGKWVAFIKRSVVDEPEYRDDSQVAIIRADGRGFHTIGRGGSASWSSDGKRLVVEVPDVPSHLVVVSADGRSRRSLLADPDCWFGAPTWSSSGTIAFAADCSNEVSGELQAIEPDGSRRRTLINDFFEHGALEPLPSWSPDGARIAFADANNGMLRMANADGSHVRDVFHAPPGTDELPAWSPDGRRLAVVFSRPPPVRANPELVASPVWEPAWSPDGHHLVGIECDDECDFLVVVDLQTRNEQTIYEHHGAAFPVAPAWSPDGRWIAFGWLYGAGKTAAASILSYDVVKRTIVGEEGRLVGDHPSWAPDGKRLAVDTYFDYLHPERSSVFTARRDGSQRRRIARNASQPAWSPDGRKIVFVRIVGRGNSELFVMNADGTHQRRLTFNAGRDDAPDWQPLPR